MADDGLASKYIKRRMLVFLLPLSVIKIMSIKIYAYLPKYDVNRSKLNVRFSLTSIHILFSPFVQEYVSF